MKTKEYYGNGKLLISGEYLVLSGAKALALPVNRGQKLIVNEIAGRQLLWKAFYPNHLWLETTIDLDSLSIIKGHQPISYALIDILKLIRQLNPSFLKEFGAEVSTILDFPPEWGLGSSSSLIHCLAQWANIDAFELQKLSFQGSGYDIACAGVNHPIIYQIQDETPHFEARDFAPSFSDQLYWVWLGDKQNSLEEIKRFKKKGVFGADDIKRISQISEELCCCEDQIYFNELLAEHEKMISSTIGQKSIGDDWLNNFPGQIKSLGAWGGDFILASSLINQETTKSWFNDRGLYKIFPFKDFIIS